MNRALYVALGLILVCVVAAGAVVACARTGRILAVDLSYSGKRVERSAGDSLVVTLPSDASTGNSWSPWVSDQTILRQTEHEYIGQVGTGGKEIFTFKCLTQGTCTISIGYGPPQQQEDEAPPAQTFDLTVVVK